VPQFLWLQSTDGSDPHTVCTRIDDAASLSKLTYYAVKLLKLLAE